MASLASRYLRSRTATGEPTRGRGRGVLASVWAQDRGDAVENLQISVCQADSDIDEHDPTGSVRRNFRRMRDALREAAAVGTRLVIFGEGYLNGYQSGALLPEIALSLNSDHEDLRELASTVDETGVSLVFGATTSRGSYPGSLYNSAIILRPGAQPIVVDKTHLSEFRYKGEPVVAERMDWAVGDQLGPVFDVDGFRIGVEICHDIVFPEVARSHSMRGAEVMINVSAAVGGFDWFWNAIPATRAFENCVWFVHATVVSDEGQPPLLGHSRVISPVGAVVCEAPDGVETTITHTLDRASVWRARASLKPFTERRPDIYD